MSAKISNVAPFTTKLDAQASHRALGANAPKPSWWTWKPR